MTEKNSEVDDRDNGFIDCLLTPEQFSLSDEDHKLLFGDGVYSQEEQERMKRKEAAINAERIPAHSVSIDVAMTEHIKSLGFGGARGVAIIRLGRATMPMDSFDMHRMCIEARKLMSQPKETVYENEHLRNAYFQIGGAPCRLLRGSIDQITGELRDSYSWHIGILSFHLTRKQLHNLLWDMERAIKKVGEITNIYRAESQQQTKNKKPA